MSLAISIHLQGTKLLRYFTKSVFPLGYSDKKKANVGHHISSSGKVDWQQRKKVDCHPTDPHGLL